MRAYCENCKWWKCFGWHYYECTNEKSECHGQSKWRGDSCNQYEED